MCNYSKKFQWFMSLKKIFVWMLIMGVSLNTLRVNADINTIALNNMKEGSFNDNIQAGEIKEYPINTDITPNDMIILSLSGLEAEKGVFHYLTLQNIATGLVVCEENNNSLNAGGHSERSRARYFIVTDEVNTRYKVVVSTPSDGGYTGRYSIDVKIVKKMSFLQTDTKGNVVSPDARTYIISSSPETLHPSPRDVMFYGAEKKPSELGENGYYLQRSLVNRNANIFWEHVNEYGRDMKFGVLLWNTEPQPLTVKLNSRSFYGNELDNPEFNCATRIWIEWERGIKSISRDETDEYYTGFDQDMKIQIPAFNPNAPSDSAKWITIHTSNGKGGYCYFTGIMDISIYDENGGEYKGQSLYCDTYCMNMGTTGGIPHHEITRQNVANMQRAFGDGTYRGSGAGAVLETNIKGNTIIDENNPFNFVITGFDVPSLNEGELLPVTDVIWDIENQRPTPEIRFIEEYNSGSPAQNHREWNGRISSCNYGVIYKIKFENLSSKMPVLGKIKFNPKVNNAFNTFVATYGYPDINVAVFDEKGNIFETALTRQNNMDASVIEGVFNADIEKGENVFYIIAGGMSFMPLEVSFENKSDNNAAYTKDAGFNRNGIAAANNKFIRSNIIRLSIDNPNMSANGFPYEIDPGNGTSPVIMDNRTLVPIRAIIEKMGGTVSWDESERKVTIDLMQNSIDLRIGEKSATVNGIEKPVDVAPQIINGRTMLPIRFISENLNCYVEWDNLNKEVFIVY